MRHLNQAEWCDAPLRYDPAVHGNLWNWTDSQEPDAMWDALTHFVQRSHPDEGPQSFVWQIPYPSPYGYLALRLYNTGNLWLIDPAYQPLCLGTLGMLATLAVDNAAVMRFCLALEMKSSFLIVTPMLDYHGPLEGHPFFGDEPQLDVDDEGDS